MGQAAGLVGVLAAAPAGDLENPAENAGAAFAPAAQCVGVEEVANDDETVAPEDAGGALDFGGLADLEAAHAVVPAKVIPQRRDLRVVMDPAGGRARVGMPGTPLLRSQEAALLVDELVRQRPAAPAHRAVAVYGQGVELGGPRHGVTAPGSFGENLVPERIVPRESGRGLTTARRVAFPRRAPPVRLAQALANTAGSMLEAAAYARSRAHRVAAT